MHNVRLEVIQQALIVRNHKEAAIFAAHGVYAVRHGLRHQYPDQSPFHPAANLGSSIAICRLAFSPPEKPTFTARFIISSEIPSSCTSSSVYSAARPAPLHRADGVEGTKVLIHPRSLIGYEGKEEALRRALALVR